MLDREVNGRARIKVEKRTYRPTNWTTLREVMVECRITPKRVYGRLGMVEMVFDKATGRQIQPVDHRVNESIRYSLIEAWDA